MAQIIEHNLTKYSNEKVTYITLSELAVKKIIEKLALHNGLYCGIRISVDRKGCSGLSYKVDLIEEKDIEATDDLLDHQRVKVFINPKAILAVVGMLMDYQYQISEQTGVIISEGYIFVNPNEKGKCGCGESFII